MPVSQRQADSSYYTMESISRLNLRLDVNQRDHSVVGQPSNYESEASTNPLRQQNRENGRLNLLDSSGIVNPKVLRLPQDSILSLESW